MPPNIPKIFSCAYCHIVNTRYIVGSTVAKENKVHVLSGEEVMKPGSAQY